jgi:hypothetical protein
MKDTGVRRVFRFSVEPGGKFTYDPSGDWAYHRPDTIRFETTSGQFTVNFVPKTVPPYANFNPLRGPLESTIYSNGVFAIETTVHDNLPESEREELRKENTSKAHPDGFIARYIYAIAVKDQNGRIVYKDDTHNGTYTC